MLLLDTFHLLFELDEYQVTSQESTFTKRNVSSKPFPRVPDLSEKTCAIVSTRKSRGSINFAGVSRAKNNRGNVARDRGGTGLAWLRLASPAIRSQSNLWFRTAAGDNGVEPVNERAAA